MKTINSKMKNGAMHPVKSRYPPCDSLGFRIKNNSMSTTIIKMVSYQCNVMFIFLCVKWFVI